MLFINTLKKYINILFILAFVGLLFGCSQFSQNRLLDSDYRLEGDIYSHANIPDNAEITLSISPLDIVSSNNETYSYHFKTNKVSRVVYFKANIPDHLMTNKKPLGISVRIEKDEALIMMTNKIVPLPLLSSEKISLPVLSMQ